MSEIEQSRGREKPDNQSGPVPFDLRTRPSVNIKVTDDKLGAEEPYGADHLAGEAEVERYRQIETTSEFAASRVRWCKDELLSQNVRITAVDNVSAEAARSFEETSRCAIKLRHENIVPIYDSFCTREELCLVGPSPEGVSLTGYIKEITTLPAVRSIDIAIKICDAILYASTRGVPCHGALSTSRVFIDDTIIDELGVKVSDFGLGAAAATAPEADRLSLADGDPFFYQAPEVAPGRAVAHSADVYSIGCILAECVTGSRANSGWTADDVKSLREQGLTLDSSSDSSVPTQPLELEELVNKCLSGNCEDRPPLEDLRNSLAELKELLIYGGGTLPESKEDTSADSFDRGFALAAVFSVAILILFGAALNLLVMKDRSKPLDPSQQAWISAFDGGRSMSVMLGPVTEGQLKKYIQEQNQKSLWKTYRISPGPVSDVDFSGATFEGEQVLAPLSRLSTLKSISFDSTTQITRGLMESLVDPDGDGKTDLESLEKISFDNCGIAHGALEPLSKLPNLIDLDVKACGITSADLSQLRNLPLKSLSLRYNQAITDQSLMQLAAIKSLKNLNATATCASYSGAIQFRKLRPDCIVVCSPAEYSIGEITYKDKSGKKVVFISQAELDRRAHAIENEYMSQFYQQGGEFADLEQPHVPVLEHDVFKRTSTP